jgi:hypothetical protein
MDVFASLVFVAFMALGVWLLASGIRFFGLTKLSRTWPTTVGTIKSSRVEIGRDADSFKTYRARIVFNYSVCATSYTGKTVFFGDEVNLRQARAEELVKRFPVGAEVDVFYNPIRPDIGILVPGVHWGSCGWIIGGLGFIILPLWILLWIWGAF